MSRAASTLAVRGMRAGARAPRTRLVPPFAQLPPGFKENANWKLAQPRDAFARLPWRQLRGDHSSPKTVELMTLNHTGDLVPRAVRPAGAGIRFGLMPVALDPVAADLQVGTGTFGWAGAYGSTVNIEPQANMVTMIMMQTATGSVQRDFENAVWQAIVE